MNLTLTLLAGILESQCRIKTRAESQLDRSCYKSARLFSIAKGSHEKSMVYVYVDDKTKAVHIVGLQDSSDELNRLIVENQDDLYTVYNTVISIFEDISDWVFRMRQACFEPDAIYQVITVGQEKIAQPMYVTNPGYKVYAMSNNPEMCDMSHSWKYAYRQGYLPLDIIINLTESKELRSRKYINNAILTSSTSFYTDFINYSVAKDDIIYGHLLVIEIFRKFKEYEIELVNIIGRVLFRIITSSKVASLTSDSIYEPFIIDVMNQTLSDRAVIAYQLEALGWSPACKYCVISVGLLDNHELPLRAFCNAIEQQIRHTISIIYEDGIVLVAHFNACQEFEDFKSEMLVFLMKSNLYAGISDTFDDFLSLSIYYKQARAAIALRQREPDKRLVNFTDIAWEHFIARSKDNLETSNYIHPAIKQLEAIDAQEKTAYTVTLRKYIENDRTVGKTAECLFLHRNTLMNRLEKIKQLTGVDLEDYGVFKRMMLSFELLDCN